MSLTLGKIHYWLYNKILWFENIEQEIAARAKEKSPAVEGWLQQIYAQYGHPTGNQPLEEIIDTSNIHGWLQGRIAAAELRQAALVTRLLEENIFSQAELIEIFKRQGEDAAREYRQNVTSPEEVFNALNDFILEGMPCDRVNEVLTSTDNEFSWRATRCLHEEYWRQAGGDVQNFYNLREAWVAAFVETLNTDFTYEKDQDGVNRIIRKQ
ncbi:hypothetical protein [Dethiobacter alkaliphilus]|uniref:hypothetical protein n=1 Tax=Dethiobacter alkaliphilus TaxID=427926 RepID=UPI002227C179|nr:hypothetical protein [Dethiobacter alkaliphilus]MCW3489279.1 hypothetical protein [Dethiobacter alkaliphilus]